MTGLVAYLLLFVGIGVFFVLFHLLLGKLVRPAKPHAEKLTIYECGEPTVGSAWIQFDLRFYVVALLFVIFDVEVAFFFPWAVLFGQANQLAGAAVLTDTQRKQIEYQIDPGLARRDDQREAAQAQQPGTPIPINLAAEAEQTRAAAHKLAWFAFWDLLVFFGVLLVGFAYLWKRGDLDWVRSTAAERAPPPVEEALAPRPESPALVGAGREY
jgi:NADH-quinone oxidoreductase subunit A